MQKSIMTLFTLLLLVSIAAATEDVPTLNPPVNSELGELPDRPSPSQPQRDNLILNGDFENTSAVGCAFNLLNGDFNGMMADATAFGTDEQIDIMNDPGGCGYLGPPQSGEVKLGMSGQPTGEFDAFAFGLSEPIVGGAIYTVSFYGWNYGMDFAPDIGPIQIGVSNSAVDSGVQVFEATPPTDGWGFFEETFTAPVDGNYLTVVAAATGDTWIHVDNFSLTLEVVAVEESTWSALKSLYR